MKLLEKLLKITEEMGSLEKSGTNSHQHYKYVKGEDAMKAFRKMEINHHIKVIPKLQSDSLEVTRTEKGQLTTCVIDYMIFDLDSDETITVTLPSQGYDSTDKGIFKAMTGGFKYFLLQTFSYSSDDPEKETSDNAGSFSTSTKASESRFRTTTSNSSFKTAAKGNGKTAPKEETPVTVDAVSTKEVETPKTDFKAPVASSAAPTTSFKTGKFSDHYNKGE